MGGLMKCLRTEIPEVILLEPQRFEDERGWFMEAFHQQRFAAGLAALGVVAPTQWSQDNESCSRRGVLRGLHYQLAPQAQGKLIRVSQGAIFDVAVDVRRTSPRFGRWVGVTLTADQGRQIWIPPGFAHGFLSLEDNTHVLYKTTAPYAPECERALRWNDPLLGIGWPVLAEALIISGKDATAPMLMQADVFEAPIPG